LQQQQQRQQQQQQTQALRCVPVAFPPHAPQLQARQLDQPAAAAAAAEQVIACQWQLYICHTQWQLHRTRHTSQLVNQPSLQQQQQQLVIACQWRPQQQQQQQAACMSRLGTLPVNQC
jgi:hypothetical protein